VDEYVCVTVLSRPGESETDFSRRLSALWTALLRTCKSDFEKVYAETTEFEEVRGRLSRQYLLEESVVERVAALLRESGLDFEPIDREERYSKYEAVPPEWMQIEH